MSQDRKQDFDGKAIAARLPTRPGVYLMRDEEGQPLYVGKARNLRKRVASYFDAPAQDRADHADGGPHKTNRGQPDTDRR